MKSVLVLALAIGGIIGAKNNSYAWAANKKLTTRLVHKARTKLTDSKQKVAMLVASAATVTLLCSGLACSDTPQPTANSNWHAPDTTQITVTNNSPRPIYLHSPNDWHDAEKLLPTVDLNATYTELALFFHDGRSYTTQQSQPTNKVVFIVYDNAVKIILTFDDGPDTRRSSANGTRRVLNTLQDHDINAVFFIQSHARDDNNNYFRGMEESVGIPTVERMHAEGHIIATHTGMDGQRAHGWENRHPRRETIGELGADLDRNKEYILARTGAYPRYVRPPFGAHSPAVRSRYASRNLNMILWDIDSRDTVSSYDSHDIREHLQREVTRLITQGKQYMVILFHDIDKHTNSPGNLDTYINTIDSAINNLGLEADFGLSTNEIHQILANY